MINSDRQLSTFLSLVQIDSPTGSESVISDWLLDFLTQHHISAAQDSLGNIVAKLSGLGEPILLTAHMDTVEPGRGVQPKIVDGIIRSAGDTILGADNKVGLSAILETLVTLAESHNSHPPIEAIFTISEESGNLGAAQVDLAGISAKSGYSFDASGDLGTIITASPFYNRFDITLTGQAAHAAHPEAAKNVLDAAGPALSQLKFGWVDADTIVNIGKISGGVVRNTIPGELILAGEIRSFTQTGLDAATEHVVSTLKQAGLTAGITVKADVVTENSGFKLASNHPAIDHASSILIGLGLAPKLQTTFACFDANVFHSRGIEVINLSDGTRDNHTTSESVSVSHLRQLAEICLGLCQ